MERIQQVERDRDRNFLRIGELRPRGLVVRLDRRLVLRKRELEARVRIQMTVRNVMDNLFYSPSARAVSRLELVAR